MTTHCDDAELWAGGTIAALIESGATVAVAIMRYDEVRRREALAAGEVLGFTPRFLPDPQTAQSWLLELLDQEEPEVLFTHPPNDPHFEHTETHQFVVRALTKYSRRKRAPGRWYAFDTYYLTQQPPGCPLLIDVSRYFQRKCEALRQHQSQPIEELLQMIESVNRLRGLERRCEYAEAFHPFALLGRWPVLRELP